MMALMSPQGVPLVDETGGGLKRYMVGDATRPVGDGVKIIAHVCNDKGLWGKGFVLALSARWPEPEADYRRWFRDHDSHFGIGCVRMVDVEPGIVVANMIAQIGVHARRGVPPIRYASLARCLRFVAVYAVNSKASVHMPRIGCGLAGGEWGIVEKIIQAELVSRGVGVTVYDLPKAEAPPL